MNIGFIGLGKLGLPCAEVMAEYYSVFGYDLCEINSSGITTCNQISEVVANSKLIFIAVQTPHHHDYGGTNPTSKLEVKNFDYTPLQDCILSIADYVTTEHTIVIISTVLPGTIRKNIAPLLPKGRLIYNPYLIAMGTVKYDLQNPEMIIMGSENGSEASFTLLKEVYKNITNSDCRFESGTWEEAEAIKIFYNTFISAKISIVNMIQDVAEKNGNINVDIVTNALANSNKRIVSKAYMKAGMGDGGPCHPRDNIALSWLSKELDLGYDLFNAIIESREVQAFNLAQKLLSFNKPIVILGCSYKPNVEYLDGSYSLLIEYYIKQNKGVVYREFAPNASESFVYLLGHDILYKDSDFNFGSVIVDPWRIFKTTRSDLSVIHYGNTRIN